MKKYIPLVVVIALVAGIFLLREFYPQTPLEGDASFGYAIFREQERGKPTYYSVTLYGPGEKRAAHLEIGLPTLRPEVRDIGENMLEVRVPSGGGTFLCRYFDRASGALSEDYFRDPLYASGSLFALNEWAEGAGRFAVRDTRSGALLASMALDYAPLPMLNDSVLSVEPAQGGLLVTYLSGETREETAVLVALP